MRPLATLLGAALCGALLAACAADTPDEALGEDASEVVTGRCASVKATRAARVKVMTVNLRHDADEWQRRFELIADEIVRLDPDLVGMQEVEIGRDQADALNDRLARRGHARYHVYDKRKSGIAGFFSGEGIAIMSRWPIVERHHEDTGAMRVSILARVAHPSGGALDLVDTHLDHLGGEAGDARRLDQMRQTIDLADRHDGCHPTFLVGDMNATETSPAMKHAFASGFVDSYRAVHQGATAPGGNTAMVVLREGAFEQTPKRRIDFVLGRSAGRRTVVPVSSTVCFENHDAAGFYPSDHLGVMTTYDVKM